MVDRFKLVGLLVLLVSRLMRLQLSEISAGLQYRMHLTQIFSIIANCYITVHSCSIVHGDLTGVRTGFLDFILMMNVSTVQCPHLLGWGRPFVRLWSLGRSRRACSHILLYICSQRHCAVDCARTSYST